MKEIDTIGIRLCDEQGELFEKSLEINKLGSALFIKNYMHSDLAIKFDNLSIINDIFISDFYIEECESKKYKNGGIRYSKNTLFWIGYIYRYWSYTRKISSKELYKYIKPALLAKYYEIYHTLDPEQAIARIIEASSINTKVEKNPIEIYKNIIANNSSF